MENWKIVFTLVLQLWVLDVTTGWLYATDNCYPDIGCFPNTGVFYNSEGFLAQGPSQQAITFLYKGYNGDVTFTLEETQQRLRDVYYSHLKTVVIIHGYNENAERPWIRSMVDAFNTRRYYVNIFIVDWSEGAANALYYHQSVANARVAGAVIGLFLNELIGLGASPSDMHLIGFSLGAHVAGYVGERVPGLGRITGLDPAGPAFRHTDPRVRLDPTDATVVDVIHTNRFLGTLTPLGTVDFYPNRGSRQPSCGLENWRRFREQNVSRETLSQLFGCSHKRATELFTSSIIDNCSYRMLRSVNVRQMRRNEGTECRDACPTFGYDLNPDFEPGLYSFNTTGSDPYCMIL